jgi:hypothetical protein
MNQQAILLNISILLSRFKVQISILNAASMLDINVVAEDFLIPILNEIFNCNLSNANSVKKNYPAVDLIDEYNRIAFQVTSTSANDKIKNTINKFIENQMFSDFNELYIIIIGDRKRSEYPAIIFHEIQEKNVECSDKNIIDIERLFQRIKSLSLDKIKNVEYYLQSQYTDTKTTQIIQSHIGTIAKKLVDVEREHDSNLLNSAVAARSKWLDKKAFLETEIVSVYDLNQKFSTRKSIEECNSNISQYEKQIYELTQKTS